MKKFNLLCMLGILCNYTLLAQFTIQSPSINVGENITQIIANGVFVQDAGEEGENVMWDYNWFIGIDQVELTYQETNATGLSEIFTSSNYALANDDMGEFYNHSDQKTERVGLLMQSILIDYEDPITVLEYPFSYMQSFTDSIVGNYQHQGIDFIINGNIAVTADAYGDLILPYGTIENVMRLKYEVTGSEDYEVSGMPHQNQFTQTSYAWYTEESSLLPLLNISFLESDVSTETSVTYLAQSVGLNEILAEQIDYNIYPNPTAEFTHIEFTLEHDDEVEITLYSLLGVKIKTIEKDVFMAGKYSRTISLEELNPGTYFISTKIGAKEISRTINIH
jgi:hypothetical protein